MIFSLLHYEFSSVELLSLSMYELTFPRESSKKTFKSLWNVICCSGAMSLKNICYTFYLFGKTMKLLTLRILLYFKQSYYIRNVADEV